MYLSQVNYAFSHTLFPMKTYHFLFILLMLITQFIGCKPDPCKDIECQNGGVCVDGVCECLDNFEGVSCEYASITAFLGSYKASYSGCFTVGPDHKVAIAEGEGAVPTVYLTGLGDYECPGANEVQVKAVIAQGGLAIPDQTVCEDLSFEGYTFMGQGSKQGDTLLVTFEVSYEVDGTTRTDNCIATLIRE